jgi:hypothetical protein
MFKRNERKGYDPVKAVVPGTDPEATERERKEFSSVGDPPSPQTPEKREEQVVLKIGGVRVVR